MSKWVLAAMTASTVALTGCGSDNNNEGAAGAAEKGEDVTIRVAWWGNQERHDRTLEVIELFEEQYPNITVEAEFGGWDGYWQSLGTQAAGGNLPDIISMESSRLSEFNANDLIVDLAPFIEDGTINLDYVDDIYQEELMDGDRVLGISLGANTRALIYNRTMMEELGIEFELGYTYEDLKELMLEVKETQEEGFYGFDFANDEYAMFFFHTRQHGQSVFNEGGTGLGFDEEILVDYFAWIQDMVNDGAAPPHYVATAYMEGGQEMLHDRSAIARAGNTNQVINFSEGTNDELGITLLPALEGGEDGTWIRVGMSFAITSHSQEQEAAAKFVDFFTNSLEANEILQAERGVPISSQVREHLTPMLSGPVLETFEFLDFVIDHTSPADPLPPAGDTEIRDSFLRLVERLKFNLITPEEATEQFIQEANEILN